MDDLSDLSDSRIFLDAVRSIAGEEGVKAVLAARGGTKVLIPTRMRPGPRSWLSLALGQQAADKICEEMCVRDSSGKVFGKFWVRLPLGESPWRKVLAEQKSLCESLLLNGGSLAATARATGLTTRTVSCLKLKLIAEGKLPRNAPLRRRP